MPPSTPPKPPRDAHERARGARIPQRTRCEHESQTRPAHRSKLADRRERFAIVSLAASNPGDAPRGMEFLLNRNRLNVAISRAQWAAYVVHSPALAGTDLSHLRATVSAGAPLPESVARELEERNGSPTSSL